MNRALRYLAALVIATAVLSLYVPVFLSIADGISISPQECD